MSDQKSPSLCSHACLRSAVYYPYHILSSDGAIPGSLSEGRAPPPLLRVRRAKRAERVVSSTVTMATYAYMLSCNGLIPHLKIGITWVMIELERCTRCQKIRKNVNYFPKSGSRRARARSARNPRVTRARALFWPKRALKQA